MALYAVAFTVALGFAFIVGSIPFAFVVGRVLGVDIRKHGSGNVGATNVFRVLGPIPGAAVFLLDFLKGALAVVGAIILFAAFKLPIVYMLSSYVGKGTAIGYVPVLAGLAALLGHTYTPFLGFKGGKGVATGAGVLLVITPLAVPISLVVFGVVLLATGYVSAGSVAIAVLYPLIVWLLYSDRPGALAFAIVAGALVVWRHRSNLMRISRGEEPRVHFRRKDTERP